MYRRAVLIYNPAAGRGRRRRAQVIEESLAVLRQQAASIEALPTSAPGSATELARRACEQGADLVLVCGGDGTINEAINGMVHTAAPLAVLPAGTANVFALELGLPLNPVRAAAMLPQLEARRIGIGRVAGETFEPRYFVLMAGIGLDAQIVYNLNLRFKSHVGELAYWLAGLAEFGRERRPFEIEADGRRYEGTLAVAARAAKYGGDFRLAPRAHLLAERLEVVVFPSRSNLRYLRYLAGLLAGRIERLRDVTFFSAQRLEARCATGSRIYVQVDGECIGRLPARVEYIPDAITVLMPAAYARDHG